MTTRQRLITALVISFSLAGCGGSGDDANGAPSGTSPPDNPSPPATPVSPPATPVSPPATPAANAAPAIDITANSELTQPLLDLSHVELKADAIDPDDDTLSFNWSQTEGPAVTTTETETAQLNFALPLLSEPADFAFEVTVDDGNGHVVTDEITFSAKPGKLLIAYGAIDDEDISEVFRLHESDSAPVKLHEDLSLPAGVTSINAAYARLTQDRQRVVYLADRENDGNHRVRVAYVDGSGEWSTGDEFDYVPSEARTALSPTGNFFAAMGDYGATSRELRLLDTHNEEGPMENLSLLDLGSGTPATPLPVQHFAWSPDEDRLAFSRAPAAGEPLALFVYDAASRVINRVSSTPGAGLAGAIRDMRWSPDGSLIAFAGRFDVNYDQLYVVQANAVDDSSMRRVSGTLIDTRYFAWSPNNHYLAFAAAPAGNILHSTLRMADIQATAGTPPREYPVTYPTANTSDKTLTISWSPDGTRIAFLANTQAQSIYDAYIVSAAAPDGTAPNRVSGTINSVDTNSGAQILTWAPDSEHLAMQIKVDNRFVSYLRLAHRDATDGATPIDVTPPFSVIPNAYFGALAAPAWSPSGDRIAFEVTSSTAVNGFRNNIYVAPADALDASSTAIMTSGDPAASEFGAKSSQWSKDGKNLLVIVSATAKSLQEIPVATPGERKQLIETVDNGWFAEDPILSEY